MTSSANALVAPLPVAASSNLDNPKPASYLINARTVWISDIHLGFRDCKADYLLDFLNHIHCDTLYLVGDIVDLWSLKRRFCWPQKHYQVMLKFYELAAKGVRVVYVPGNHDTLSAILAASYLARLKSRANTNMSPPTANAC